MDKKETEDLFLQQISEKGKRKLKAKLTKNLSIWVQLGTLGLIGWTVSIPTVIGVTIGWFIDKKFFFGHRWTLSLLILGILMGCWNAWYWVSKQCKEINGDQKENDE